MCSASRVRRASLEPASSPRLLPLESSLQWLEEAVEVAEEDSAVEVVSARVEEAVAEARVEPFSEEVADPTREVALEEA